MVLIWARASVKCFNYFVFEITIVRSTSDHMEMQNKHIKTDTVATQNTKQPWRDEK